jgi:DnaJ-class molecular chaperone
MAKTKKIYEHINVLVKPCKWCEGRGVNTKAFIGQRCGTCNGTGGEWKRRRILVREEVVDD